LEAKLTAVQLNKVVLKFAHRIA